MAKDVFFNYCLISYTSFYIRCNAYNSGAVYTPLSKGLQPDKRAKPWIDCRPFGSDSCFWNLLCYYINENNLFITGSENIILNWKIPMFEINYWSFHGLTVCVYYVAERETCDTGAGLRWPFSDAHQLSTSLLMFPSLLNKIWQEPASAAWETHYI